MPLKQNPRIPEGINASDENPLKEFAILLIGIGAVFALLVIVLSLMAQSLAPFIPFSWEQRLTNSIASQSGRNVDDTPDEVDAEQALRDLAGAIWPHVRADKNIDYSVHLINQSTPNAFATLGGHIFITSGLLDVVSSENALAMVMAHEMSHVKHRHPIQALSRGAILQLLFSLLGSGQNSGAIQQVLGQTGLLTVLSFNRDMERESDDDAIAALQAYYGHVNGANEFFARLSRQSERSRFTEWLETHPGVESRIEKIQQARELDTTAEDSLVPLDPRLVTYLEKAGE